MKQTAILLTVFVLVFLGSAQAQENIPFTGAKATLNSYKVLYVLNNGDEKKINGTLRNIRNALEDPRLKGKVQVELIAFGDGVKIYEKTGPFENRLKELQQKGVILAMCENTLRERKIDKSALYPFISYVPSGNGEIIIRHSQGWAIVHP